MFARHSLRSLTALALAASLVAACHGTSQKRTEPTQVRGALEQLRTLQPTDVAVAPVRDQTQGQRVPLDLFRNAFIAALVERRYSPLAPAYVDGNWVESSFRGTPPPDALLLVAITAWDPTHLYSTGFVSAAAELVLFQGGDTTGKVLWQLTLSRELDLGDGKGNPPTPGQDLVPRAVRSFAQAALKELPMRDPLAAHSPPSN